MHFGDNVKMIFVISDEVKDEFYDDLDNIISATPRTDKLILLGD